MTNANVDVVDWTAELEYQRGQLKSLLKKVSETRQLIEDVKAMAKEQRDARREERLQIAIARASARREKALARLEKLRGKAEAAGAEQAAEEQPA